MQEGELGKRKRSWSRRQGIGSHIWPKCSQGQGKGTGPEQISTLSPNATFTLPFSPQLQRPAAQELMVVPREQLFSATYLNEPSSLGAASLGLKAGQVDSFRLEPCLSEYMFIESSIFSKPHLSPFLPAYHPTTQILPHYLANAASFLPQFSSRVPQAIVSTELNLEFDFLWGLYQSPQRKARQNKNYL